MPTRKKPSSDVAALRSAIRTLQKDSDAQLSMSSQLRALKSAFVTLSDAVIEEADTLRAAISAQALETDRELSQYRTQINNLVSKGEMQVFHNTLEEITSAITKLSSNNNHVKDILNNIKQRTASLEDKITSEDIVTLSDVHKLIKKSENKTLKQMTVEATENITSKLGSIAEEQAKQFLHNIHHDLFDRIDKVESDFKGSQALSARDISVLADNLNSLRKDVNERDSQKTVSDLYDRIKKVNENHNNQIDLVIGQIHTLSDAHQQSKQHLLHLDSRISDLSYVLTSRVEDLESSLDQKFNLLTTAMSKLTNALEKSTLDEGYLS
ncbi:hypothetical protein GEMRC1_005232 [Eukaryota sp. GEM-RC1]